MQPNATAPSASPQVAQQCNICLEEELDQTTIKVLDVCKHVFHNQCIDQWFKTQEDEFKDGTCPACRRVIKPLSEERRAERLRQMEMSNNDLEDVIHFAILMSNIARMHRLGTNPENPPNPDFPMVNLPLFIFPLNILFNDDEDEEEGEVGETESEAEPENEPVISLPVPQVPAPAATQPEIPTPATVPETRKRPSDDPSIEPDPKHRK